MLNLGNDMEELLKHASENYPLKEGEDRWNEINYRVNNSEVVNKKKINPNTFIPLLILFLFLQHAFLFTNDLVIVNGFSSAGYLKKERITYDNIYSGSTKEQSTKRVTGYNNAVDYYNMVPRPAGKYNSFVSIPDHKDSYQVTKKAFIENVKSTDPAPVQSDPLTDPTINEVAETKIDSIKKEQLQLTSGKDEKKSSEKKNKRFYLGALASVNLSTVKMAGMRDAGYNIGLIAGYRVSPHLSIESGLFYGKRNYNSLGKYFNEKATSMPSGMEIMKVFGSNCSVEIPFHLKYNFLLKNKSNFFGTAGLSSAIITREKNDYKVSYNSNETMMSSSYNDNRKYVAATLNFSIGFEYKRNKSNFRMEPFVQIPLQGVGIGSMPVTTFGLRAGITQ